jgi:hypothetical protein
MGYRLPEAWLRNYMLAYYQAVKIHLGDSAKMLGDWFASLVAEQSEEQS